MSHYIMFKDFLTALVHKISEFLVAHKDFFEGKREHTLEHLSIPAAFKGYLSEVSSKEFLEDLRTIILYIEDPKNTTLKNNKFFKSFLEFLTTDLARKIDHLDGSFYLFKSEEKTLIIDKLIKGESHLAHTLKMILVSYNYQQLAEEVNTLATKIERISFIVVQSPREIDSELKKEIRNKLTEEHPLSFPSFQINRKLIGGVRIFIDGKAIDNSWLSRVLRYTTQL